MFFKKKILLILERQLPASTAHQLFIAVLTNINLVKPTEPIFLYSTIRMKALLFSQLNLECLEAFMLGQHNMRPARGVS